MIADVGLLSLDVSHITGLDVLRADRNIEEGAAQEVVRAGFPVPGDYATRLKYVPYDGSTFPFPDDSFDFVFSWSAFEHIQDVPRALQEIQRVVTPTGRVFIQVYPWFHSYLGSHLSDYLEEPFVHLTESEEQIRSRLEAFATAHPDKSDLALNHMWGEYRKLNRYSARRFVGEVLDAGFAIERMQATVREEYLPVAPANVPVADIITWGSMLFMRPGKPVTEEALTASQLREQLRHTRAELVKERTTRVAMQESKSWKLTQPVRSFAELLRSMRR